MRKRHRVAIYVTFEDQLTPCEAVRVVRDALLSAECETTAGRKFIVSSVEPAGAKTIIQRPGGD